MPETHRHQLNTSEFRAVKTGVADFILHQGETAPAVGDTLRVEHFNTGEVTEDPLTFQVKYVREGYPLPEGIAVVGLARVEPQVAVPPEATTQARTPFAEFLAAKLFFGGVRSAELANAIVSQVELLLRGHVWIFEGDTLWVGGDAARYAVDFPASWLALVRQQAVEEILQLIPLRVRGSLKKQGLLLPETGGKIDPLLLFFALTPTREFPASKP